MPWKEQSKVESRKAFVRDYESGLYSMTELCWEYGISRQTGHKTLRKYQDGGESALLDKSRAPHHIPHKTDAWMERELCELRRRHPSWGPKKLREVFERQHPGWVAPSESTLGDILKRNGLVKSKPRRSRTRPPHQAPVVHSEHPNDVWTMDYKGEFRLGNRQYCYPLTTMDLMSRYLLGCVGRRATDLDGTQRSLEKLFIDCGLPLAVLHDGGPPFASNAIGGLSRLSVWLIRLGIEVLITQPASPWQNGAHERMHRTLKQETARPPKASFGAQQRCFDRFRQEFNQLRPHEALNMETPATRYRPSPKSYPAKLPKLQYPGHFEVRLVSSSGHIKLRGHDIFLSRVFAQDLVGLEEVEDAIWAISFGPVHLGKFSERKGKLIAPARSRPKRYSRSELDI